MIEYSSQVPGQEFPAFPRPDGALVLAVLHQLEQSQWLAPGALKERQWTQLSGLLAHARDSVPGYRKLWRDTGAVHGIDDLPRLPVLERDRLQEAAPAFRSQKIPAAHGPVRAVTTSGSTGKPVEVLHNQVHSVVWSAMTLRHHAWHGIDPSGRLASIRFVSDRDRARPPRGEERPSWGMPEDLVYRTGPSALLNLATPVDEQLSWLVAQDPEWLVTFPTNLDALVDESTRTGRRPGRLRGAWTVGETLPPETREKMAARWGVPLWDMYSCQEVGYVALQCPSTPHYHVQESVIVEVLDERDRPCGPGEVGRIVVTSLVNQASPLVRYAIGDWAEVGEACPCGRGLPVLTRILGRTRNMMVLPDGRRAWPYIESARCRAVAPYRQMQLVQVAAGEIEVRLVPEAGFAESHRQGLGAELQRSLGYPFQLRFSIVEAIERSASGKFEEFLCRVP